MKEASSNKTQRVKVTQYDPLYLLSTKKQVDSKRENTDESNMFNKFKYDICHTFFFLKTFLKCPFIGQ